MKNLIALLSLSLALVGGASAALYSDSNPADVLLISSVNPSYTGTFTLAPVVPGPAYNPALEYITSASATFDLFDLVGNESYSVVIDNMSPITGGSFFLSLNFGAGIFGSALADLSADGILSYTVTANSGSFWLTNAAITAESAALPSVPETSTTFGLMGAALLGLAAVRRKVRA